MSEQRTPEWFASRCGKFTASRFSDLLAVSKRDGKRLKAWDDLVWDVAVERITGTQEEGPSAYALQWGTDVEPFAREAYEFSSGNLVAESGFIIHPIFEFVGCSPDGLVGSDGGIEMKCPKSSKIHIARILAGTLPEDHKAQVQGCMWVTGRQWWDFVSYDPRMPEERRIFCVTVERDDGYIKLLEESALEAESEVNKIVEQFNKA